MKMLILKYFLLILVSFTLLIAACQTAAPVQEPAAPAVPVVEPETPAVEDTPAETQVASCTTNADCQDGRSCVNNQCIFLDELSTSGCSCRYSKVKVLTSDGETYLYPAGQGSYSSAGAIVWSIESSPRFCSGKGLVPFHIITRNYDEIFRDDVIFVKEKQTSEEIKHPLLDTTFTLTVVDVEELC